MTDENKYKEVEYYGVLITHSNTIWYVLMDRPIDRRDWMNDHERMFLACQPYGNPERIIVSGYTLREAKGKVPVENFQEMEADIQETEEEKWSYFEEWLKSEPAAKAE